MYYIMAADNEQTVFGFISMLLVLALNKNVIQKGLKSIKYGFNMYTLVLLAFGCALFWSVIYPDNAMWEATFIVIAFVGFGDSLESLAKVSATSSFAELSSMVSVGNIEIGDELSLTAGTVVPVDGIVLTGRTDLEQSVITGENMPVSVIVGDTVWAGSTQ